MDFAHQAGHTMKQKKCDKQEIYPCWLSDKGNILKLRENPQHVQKKGFLLKCKSVAWSVVTVILEIVICSLLEGTQKHNSSFRVKIIRRWFYLHSVSLVVETRRNGHHLVTFEDLPVV